MWQDEHSAFHMDAGSLAADGFAVCAAAVRANKDRRAQHAALNRSDRMGAYPVI
jgi:hypothetical protein